MEGKTANTVIDSMKGTPVLLAMLIIIAGFLIFIAYTNGKTDKRDSAYLQLISDLAKECRKGTQP